MSLRNVFLSGKDRHPKGIAVFARMCIFCGVCAICCALLAALFVRRRTEENRMICSRVLGVLEAAIPENPDQSEPEYDAFPILAVDGRRCVGVLEAETISLRLPVEDTTGDGRIPWLSSWMIRGPQELLAPFMQIREGDEIRFKDVYGLVRTYTVTGAGQVDNLAHVERADLVICTENAWGSVYAVSCTARNSVF